ncbi:MAG TPA: MBL fold metallo-hydrolase [Desulfobacteria bacterium]|nr:MBL fold metallo-hydrolase [Desulfobacteria bacterium]
MTVNIHTIPLGVDNCYILHGDGTILIDGGAPKKVKRFTDALRRFSMKPEDVKLIVLTHGHWDHIGSAREIQEITGAPIALHRHEKDCLEKSLIPLPPGVTIWGDLFVRIMALFTPMIHVPATKVDIVLNDEEFSLVEYGIPGRIIHTPGHSRGSVSVLLENGDAFVGDLAMSGFPLRFNPGLPILADDITEVRRSWELLLDKGAKTVYPAHGKPFSADIIRKTLV